MFARVSDVTGSPDKMDLGIAQFKEQVLPAIQGMDGFSRAYLLVDRAAGRALSISVWDTAEAMAATDAATAAMRDAISQTVSGQVAVGSFEIVVEG